MRTPNRYAAMAALLLVSSALVGCDGGRTRPPPVTVRVVHAAPERPPIEFFRVRRNETQIDFRQVSGALRFDSDLYEFSAQTVDLSAAAPTLVGSFVQQLTPDHDYLFVLTEPNGVFTPIVVEKPIHSGSESEIIAVHAAPSLSAMSLYIEQAGTDPVGAAPLGTLAFKDTIESATRAPGEYRLTLTDAGAPTNVQLRSGTFTLEAGQTYAFVIIDPADDSTAPISVTTVGLPVALLLDPSVPARAQVINAAADGEPRDLYLDDDFTAPLIAEAPHAAYAYGDVTFGEHTLTVTPAGNPGVIELEDTSTYARSRYHSILIAGAPGDLEMAQIVDDPRRLANQARLRVMNGASQHEELHFYIVEPGGEITGRQPAFGLRPPAISARGSVPPGDYDFFLRDPVTQSIVAGPISVALSEGIYSLLVLNGSTSSTVELVFLEDFE
jgi:hypothetical protein